MSLNVGVSKRTRLLACNSQRSLSVPSGQQRTTPKQHRPARLHTFAGDESARSGFGSRGSPVGVGHDEGIAVDRADGDRVAVITANVLWTLLDRAWERAP